MIWCLFRCGSLFDTLLTSFDKLPPKSILKVHCTRWSDHWRNTRSILQSWNKFSDVGSLLLLSSFAEELMELLNVVRIECAFQKTILLKYAEIVRQFGITSNYSTTHSERQHQHDSKQPAKHLNHVRCEATKQVWWTSIMSTIFDLTWCLLDEWLCLLSRSVGWYISRWRAAHTKEDMVKWSSLHAIFKVVSKTCQHVENRKDKIIRLWSWRSYCLKNNLVSK